MTEREPVTARLSAASRKKVDAVADALGWTRSRAIDFLVGAAADLGLADDAVDTDLVERLDVAQSMQNDRQEIIDAHHPDDLILGLPGRVEQAMENRYFGGYKSEHFSERAASFYEEAEMLAGYAQEHDWLPDVTEDELVGDVDQALAGTLEAMSLAPWYDRHDNPYHRFDHIESARQAREFLVAVVEGLAARNVRLNEALRGDVHVPVKADDLPDAVHLDDLPDDVGGAEVVQAANLAVETSQTLDAEPVVRDLFPDLYADEQADEQADDVADEQADDEPTGPTARTTTAPRTTAATDGGDQTMTDDNIDDLMPGLPAESTVYDHLAERTAYYQRQKGDDLERGVERAIGVLEDATDPTKPRQGNVDQELANAWNWRNLTVDEAEQAVRDRLDDTNGGDDQ